MFNYIRNMFIYIYVYFFVCKITVWYKKNNSIIKRTQQIVKIIFTLFLLQKAKLKNKKKLLIYNYI